jgi:gas vesicle protein
MLQSKYVTEVPSEITTELKKKLLKSKKEEDAPSTEEIDAEIQGNKPARSKELADKSSEFQDQGYKFSGGLQGNYIPPAKLDVPIDTNADRTTGQKIGDGAVAGAGGVLDMASTVMMQKGPMNKQERKANTMNMATKGLSTGAAVGGAVGGPYGALIGAGVGAVAGVATGLIQGIGDEKELQEKARVERVAYVDDVKDKRKKAQMLSDGKASVEKSQDLVKAQMGMLGSKYSTSKIG